MWCHAGQEKGVRSGYWAFASRVCEVWLLLVGADGARSLQRGLENHCHLSRPPFEPPCCLCRDLLSRFPCATVWVHGEEMGGNALQGSGGCWGGVFGALERVSARPPGSTTTPS